MEGRISLDTIFEILRGIIFHCQNLIYSSNDFHLMELTMDTKIIKLLIIS